MPNSMSPFRDVVGGGSYRNWAEAMMMQMSNELIQFQNGLRQNILRQNVIGDQVIKAGKANTAIPPTKYEGQTPAFVAAMKYFNRELTSRGMKQGDMADCRTLLVALSFEIFSNGEKANQKQLDKLRQEFRQSLLKDNNYQGNPTESKVRNYELYAVQTVLAYDIWRRSKTEKLDARIQTQAWESARGVLQRYMSSTDDLFLTPQGFQTIAAKNNNYTSPAATTLFQRTKNSIIAQEKLDQNNGFGGQEMADSANQRLRDFDRLVVSLNGQTNDLASGGAVAFMLYYQVYTGIKLNQKQLQWIRNKISHDIKVDKNYQAANDAQRQRWYEEWAMDSVYMLQSQTAGKGDWRSDARVKLQSLISPNKIEDYILTADKAREEQNVQQQTVTAIPEPETKPSKARSSTNATTTFTRVPQVLAIEGKNPSATTAQIENYLRIFDEAVKMYNGQNNDAAVANAIEFVVLYRIYYGVKLTQRQYQWLVREFVEDLKKDSSFQNLDNKDRQIYYEKIGVTTMRIFDLSRTDQNRSKEEALRGLKDTFQPRNLDNYSLTADGFVKK